MNLNLFSFYKFLLLYILYHRIGRSNSETITFISTEHPSVDWYDTKYFKNVSMFSRRNSRQDPKYYVQLYINTHIPLDNHIKLDFYFYQFLTNRYRPSFVEMHLRVCDMVQNDTIFGPTLKRELGNKECPFPPGEYDLKNLYIPYVPKGFPFTKGRIYANATLARNGDSRLVGYAKIDMELKVAKINNNGKKNKRVK